jgi:hypothetical protein
LYFVTKFIAQLAGLTSNRLVVSSVDLVTGMVIVTILPPQPGDFDVIEGNTSYPVVYKGSFALESSANLTTREITELLRNVGISALTVSIVNGSVTYTTNNVTDAMLSLLRNNSVVVAGSVTTPSKITRVSFCARKVKAYFIQVFTQLRD